MKTSLFIVISAVLISVTASCGGRQSTLVTGLNEQTLEQEIHVEAYLFDAKVYRDKKPTSVRLEFFQTDSAVGLAGRGYLGKGALKGRLTADSIEVYFPTTNEYLYEAVDDLMGSFECSGNLPRINLFALLSNLPDTILAGQTGVTVERDDSNASQPAFSVRAVGCPWLIELTYDRQDAGWRIREFVFSEGDQVTLKGKRRQFKGDAKVKFKRFVVPIGDGTVRITL